MITDERIKQVRTQLKKGMPAGELREELIREGYPEKDIEKAFAAKPYDMRSWYLSFALLLLLAGLYQIINRKGYLLPVLSAAMFFQYYRETERLKARSNQHSSSKSSNEDV